MERNIKVIPYQIRQKIAHVSDMSQYFGKCSLLPAIKMYTFKKL